MRQSLYRNAVLVAALLIAATAQSKMTELGVSGGNFSLSANPMLHTSNDGTNVAIPTYLNLFYTIDDGAWYWAEIDFSVLPAVLIQGIAYLAGADDLPDWTPSSFIGPQVLSGPPSHAFVNRLGRARAAFTYPFDIPGKLRVGLLLDGDIIYIGRGDGLYATDASEGVNILAGLGPTAMWCPLESLALKATLTGMGAFTGGSSLDGRGGSVRMSTEAYYEIFENALWAFGRVDGLFVGYNEETPNLSKGSTWALSTQLGIHWNWFQMLSDLFE